MAMTVFIAPYLRVETAKQFEEFNYNGCPKCKEACGSDYCPSCGTKTKMLSVTKESTPQWISGIIGDEYEDELYELNANMRNDSGVIVAIGNIRPQHLYFSYSRGDELESTVVDLPTDEKQKELMGKFSRDIEDIAKLLRQSDIVKSVSIHFGILVDYGY